MGIAKGGNGMKNIKGLEVGIENEKNIVYIVMDTTHRSGANSIIGTFADHNNAKLFLAEYVLENESRSTGNLDIVKQEIQDYFTF